MEDLEKLESFSIKKFQENFDYLMERVENGESFIIRDGNKSAIIVPYNETIKYTLDKKIIADDELIRLHTDHEEGS